jgi:hypothetical protein
MVGIVMNNKRHCLWIDSIKEPPDTSSGITWWWARNIQNAREIVNQKHDMIDIISVDLYWENLEEINDFFHYLRERDIWPKEMVSHPLK